MTIVMEIYVAKTLRPKNLLWKFQGKAIYQFSAFDRDVLNLFFSDGKEYLIEIFHPMWTRPNPIIFFAQSLKTNFL